MKTLIIYGSRRGTTKYCAELIHKTLGEESSVVDVKSKDTKSYLENCEQIIVGANAFNFKLNKDIRSFITRHLSTILEKKVFLYICCGAEGGKATLSLYKDSNIVKWVSTIHNNLEGTIDDHYECKK